MNSRRAKIPHEILAQLRLVCLDQPEACEEEAWAGTRWMVAKKNFAHVLMIDEVVMGQMLPEGGIMEPAT